MITNIILFVILSVVYLILSPLLLLDDATLPAGLTTALQTASTYLANVDIIFPVSTMLTILGLFLAIEAVILIYHIILFVIRKIPGIN